MTPEDLLSLQNAAKGVNSKKKGGLNAGEIKPFLVPFVNKTLLNKAKRETLEQYIVQYILEGDNVNSSGDLSAFKLKEKNEIDITPIDEGDEEQEETTIFCLYDIKKADYGEWFNQDNNVYIDSKISWLPASTHSIFRNTGMSVANYEKWLREKFLADTAFLEEFENLRGKTLGCWCSEKSDNSKNPKPCHGEIIIKLLNEGVRRAKKTILVAEETDIEVMKNFDIHRKETPEEYQRRWAIIGALHDTQKDLDVYSIELYAELLIKKELYGTIYDMDTEKRLLSILS